MTLNSSSGIILQCWVDIMSPPQVKAKRDILGKKKNKKNSKPKKAKQLGGVIKRVIKLTKQQNKI